MRVEYTPIVHIQKVKNKKGQAPITSPDDVETDNSGMIKGICETLKYTVKESDLVGKFCDDDDVNSNWLKSMTTELYGLKRVEYAGVLKPFGKEVEKAMDDLIKIDDEQEDSQSERNGRERIAFWNSRLKEYVMKTA
jgi:hypothetical protein